MEHSNHYYTKRALEKSASLKPFLIHYGLDILQDVDSNPTRRSVYALADFFNLLKRGRLEATLEAARDIRRSTKRASLTTKVKSKLTPANIAIGGAGALGLGLAIRAAMPSRFARVYINDVNAKMKAYTSKREDNDSGIK